MSCLNKTSGVVFSFLFAGGMLLGLLLLSSRPSEIELQEWVVYRDTAGISDALLLTQPATDWHCADLPFPGSTPRSFCEQRSGNYWYRTVCNLPAEDSCFLFIAGSADAFDVWVNTQKVASKSGASQAITLDITHAIKEGRNDIRIKTTSYYGQGILYRPLRIVFSSKQESESLRKIHERKILKLSDVVQEIDFRRGVPARTWKEFAAMIPSLQQRGITVLQIKSFFPLSELSSHLGGEGDDAVRSLRTIDFHFGTLEEFRHVVAGAHERGMKVILECILDRIAWDSDVLMEHPEWFDRTEDGEMRSPDCASPATAKFALTSHEVKKYLLATLKYWIRETDIDGYCIRYAATLPYNFLVLLRSQLETIKPSMLLADCSIEDGEVFDAVASIDLGMVLPKMMLGGKGIFLLPSFIENQLQFCAEPMASVPLVSSEVCSSSDLARRELSIAAIAFQLFLPVVPVLTVSQQQWYGAVVNSFLRVRTKYQEVFATTPKWRTIEEEILSLQWKKGNEEIRMLLNTDSSVRTVHFTTDTENWSILFSSNPTVQFGKKNGKFFVSLGKYESIVMYKTTQRNSE